MTAQQQALRAILLGLMLCLATALPAAAQAPGAESASTLAPLDRSSPSATMRSFATEAERLERAFVAYREDKTFPRLAVLFNGAERLSGLFDLREIPPATRAKAGRESVGYLKDILMRLPDPSLADIPGAPGWTNDLPDRWTIPGTEISIARATTGPQVGAYLFTADTVARLAEFHARIIGQPPLRPSVFDSWRAEATRLTGPLFPAALPAPLLVPVLGTPVWKLLFALLALAGILGLVRLWHRLTRGAVHRAAPVLRLLWRMTTPALLAALVLAFQAFNLFQLNLTGAAAAAETSVALVLLYAAAAWLAWLGCFLIVEAIIASPSVPDDSYDAHLLRLAARVLSLIAAGLVIAYGANDLGAPALGLVASLGVGGIAVALAAQSTIENLFGGVSIFADRPFRVGDSIKYGSGSGKVLSIGPRSCRIRGDDGTVTTVTNGELAKMAVTNVSMRDKCLFSHRLALDTANNATKLRDLLGSVRTVLQSHARVETAPGWPRVHLTSLSSDGIGLEISAHLLTTSTPEFLLAQQELILEILAELERAGIVLATPSGMAPAPRVAQTVAAAGEAVSQAGQPHAGPAAPRGAG